MKKDSPDVALETYLFMTSDPNMRTATINHERSPVLPTAEAEWQAWTTCTPAEALALIRPIPLAPLRIVLEGLEKRDLGPSNG